MNEEVNEAFRRKKKKTWDVIGIVGIIIVLIAAGYTYYESRICHNPLKTLVKMTAEREDNLDYTYAIVEFYDNDLLLASYKLDYNGRVMPNIISDTLDLNASKIKEDLKKLE